MQTDMHYYGTYAMARAAGFRDDIAQTIATAAEYVDDSDRLDVVCKDGFPISAEPTAHHPTNLKDNTDPQDQRRTWVPFHFLPGCKGDSVEEKLRCVTDSDVARKVVAHTLANADKDFGIPLLGILAHCYVDTFSHYGFSGISSSVNQVDPNSFKFYCSEKQKNSFRGRFDLFLARYAVGPFANSLVKLGHGSVATFPDQPFLSWEFSYMNPKKPSGLRENPKTFLAGCERLHEIFVAARERFNGELDDLNAYREFKDIRGAVEKVLATEGDDKERAEAWGRASRAKELCGVAAPIPAYNPGMFTTDLERLEEYEGDFARRTLVYAFLQAADFHRDYLLNTLLPQYGVHIESAPVQWHGKE